MSMLLDEYLGKLPTTGKIPIKMGVFPIDIKLKRYNII